MTMRNVRSFQLAACAMLIFVTTVVCSTGYITPASLAATQQAQDQLNATATALSGLLIPTVGAGQPTQTANPALASPTVAASVTSTLAPAESPTAAPPFVYTAQSGDTLAALAVRFAVDSQQIASPQDIPATGLINAGQIFTIPNVVGPSGPNDRLIPDSEVVDSPTSIDFNTASYVGRMAGYLANYQEYLPSRYYTGAGVVERVAYEHSISPRLLLAVLQEQSDWVLGEPLAGSNPDYPMGKVDPQEPRLYHQLSWAARMLSVGYYHWREGTLTELTFPNGQKVRIAPDLNAGTVAIQYLFSQLYDYDAWLQEMNPDTGFAFTFGKGMFPDPWVRAAQVEPLFPPDLANSVPHMGLPFFSNQIWYLTGGPHGAWELEGAQAALDFAPASTQPGCAASDAWVTAASEGLVVRAQDGQVVVDSDGDGYEQTGWVILYLHVADITVRQGDWVNRYDKLGHPSCLGGVATGTHLHIARKYNGEWIDAGEPIPMVLSGWTAQAGAAPYEGALLRGNQVVTACTCSNVDARISRSADDPY